LIAVHQVIVGYDSVAVVIEGKTAAERIAGGVQYLHPQEAIDDLLPDPVAGPEYLAFTTTDIGTARVQRGQMPRQGVFHHDAAAVVEGAGARCLVGGVIQRDLGPVEQGELQAAENQHNQDRRHDDELGGALTGLTAFEKSHHFNQYRSVTIHM